MGEGVAEVTLLQCLLFGCIVSAVDPVAVLAIFQEVRFKQRDDCILQSYSRIGNVTHTKFEKIVGILNIS